uniref:Uncharacterized protein n=1 Tax=Ascaris lumbricoides TaxID=6252 RepID=A0A0M3IH41_ASCLU
MSKICISDANRITENKLEKLFYEQLCKLKYECVILHTLVFVPNCD